jgi:serine protease AprX
VPAPILPGTPEAARALLYAKLDAATDERLAAVLARHRGLDHDLDALQGASPSAVRRTIGAKIRERKILSGYLQEAEGTSMAAPIVSSVVAQMLEANPALTPPRARTILFQTARRLAGVAPERQGFGVVQPRLAVEAACSA